MNKQIKEKGRIDWLITLVPFALIMGLAIFLFIFPEQSNDVIGQVRFFFGDTLGSYYLIIGMQKWEAVLLNGQAYFPFSIGALFHGRFIWF